MQILFMLSQNAAIGTPQTWEQSEKLVNALELQIFIQDSATATQLGSLDALGSLCPHINGEAVLRAQVIYNQFVEKEFSPVCTGNRGAERWEYSQSATPIRLYPNPSTGMVTIPNPAAEERMVQVFDIAGRLVHVETTSDFEFDLSDLENGVYLLRIRDTGTGRIDSAKLIISK